jgi:hypothetical protein|tara:strand:+ start:24069 stop:24347 length:279 start_codon:yes stop_codon:yes gene_type:complete
MSSNLDSIEIKEFLEQVDYALSLEFKEKWRHRFSDHFISIFQSRLLKSLKEEKPVKKDSLISLYTKKHKYNISEVLYFFEVINISLYRPIVY